MEEIKTQTEEIIEEQPKTSLLDKIKTHKFKILGGVLGILVFAGAVFGAYKFGTRQAYPEPVEGPTPTPAAVTTPTPDLTADWKVFTSEEYGFEFKYPERLKIEENKYQGERGYAYCLNFKKSLSIKSLSVQNVYAGAAGCYFEDFGIGGISTDFEAGRSGGFTDTRGYRKEEDRIIFKFAGTKEYEIPQELVKQVFTNPNQVEIVVVEGKSHEDSPFPIMGTPGDGYLGALINTRHPYLTGLAAVYSKTSSLLSEEEFNLMLSTFRFLEETALPVVDECSPKEIVAEDERIKYPECEANENCYWQYLGGKIKSHYTCCPKSIKRYLSGDVEEDREEISQLLESSLGRCFLRVD